MKATFLASQILDQVNQLPFTDTHSFELMSLANKVYVLVYAHVSPNRKEGLAPIKQIMERQIHPLLEENLLLEERIKLFQKAKANLATLLQAYTAN